MAVQEREVNTVLAVEVPHGVVDPGADDGNRGLIITILLEPHLLAPLKQLQEIEHGKGFAS